MLLICCTSLTLLSTQFPNTLTNLPHFGIFHCHEVMEMAVCDWFRMQEPNLYSELILLNSCSGNIFKNWWYFIRINELRQHCTDFSFKLSVIESIHHWTSFIFSLQFQVIYIYFISTSFAILSHSTLTEVIPISILTSYFRGPGFEFWLADWLYRRKHGVVLVSASKQMFG